MGSHCTTLAALDATPALWRSPELLSRHSCLMGGRSLPMRPLLLWLIGIPIPVILLLWLVGAFN
jgi:hypothetical protein